MNEKEFEQIKKYFNKSHIIIPILAISNLLSLFFSLVLEDNIIYVYFAVLFLMIFFSILMYIRHKKTRKIFNNIKLQTIDKLYEQKTKNLNDKINQMKKELDTYSEKVNNNALSLEKDTFELLDIKKKELDEITTTISNSNLEIEELNNKILKLKKDYIELDEEVLYQSYGIYIPEYLYDLSETYQDKIKEITEKEKIMIKNEDAFQYNGALYYNESLAQGKQVQKKTAKLLIRSFNDECEESINKVTPINYESKKKKIESSYSQLNKLQEKANVEISYKYKELKLEKLDLMLQYKLVLEEEKEKAREEREKIREEEKAQREIKAQKDKLNLEIERFNIQLGKYTQQLAQTNDIKMKVKIQTEIDLILQKLDILKDEEKELDYRLNNTRAGYVYIISNIGSFGENVYKIGLTRRLEPNDRIRELGDASVPFKFDKHALIFSDDAYGLEQKLHKLFHKKRINKINFRKEFFNVTIDEIKEAVHTNFNGTVDFITDPKAIEFRETLALEKTN